MPSWKENWPVYRRRLLIALNFFVIFCGLLGTYEYYRPSIQETWRLLAAMWWGTVKLYFLSPTIPVDAPITPLYEIAKWVAPLMTSAIVYTLLGNVFRHARNLMRYRHGRKTAVIGDSEATRRFLRNAAKEPNMRTLLFRDAPLSAEEIRAVERTGVTVLQQDFRLPADAETRLAIRSARLDRVENLLLFYDDDLDNYTAFTTLLEALDPSQTIRVRIRCTSERLRDLMLALFEKAGAERPALRRLDIRFFDTDELAAEAALQQAPWSLTTVPVERLAGGSFRTAEEIDRAVGTVHILHIGFHRIARYLTEKAASAATVSLHERQRVSVIDQSATRLVDAFLAAYPEIHRAMEIIPYDVDIRSRQMATAVQEIITDAPPLTSVFIHTADALLGLEALHALSRAGLSRSVPVGIRNTTGHALLPVFEAALPGGRVFSFGEDEHVLTPDVVLSDALDAKAIRHNDQYNAASERFGNGPGSAWEALSAVKRDSSRAAALHAPTKRAVLDALVAQEPPGALSDAAERLADVFQRETHAEANRALLALLEEHPVVDYLTRLEHMRWCRYYYSIHFRHGDTKDEAARTHPCLVEEWETIAGPLYNLCYPIFDAIAVFSLLERDEQAN